jgi:hypothetical protein
MTNRDGVVPYQNVLYNQPHNSLPFDDTKRISRTAQTRFVCLLIGNSCSGSIIAFHPIHAKFV